MRVITDHRPYANGEVIDTIETASGGPVPAGEAQPPHLSLDELPF